MFKVLETGESRGGFRVLVRGGRGGERSEPKFFGPPLSIFGPPLQGGGPKIDREGPTINPQTYKERADI